MIKHCPFTLLEIILTEDEKRIEEAFHKTREKYKGRDNSPDPLKMQHYKDIMQAGAALYKPGTQRRAIIQAHLDALAAFIPFWLQPVQQQGATAIALETHNLMMAAATDENGPYHLDGALAKQVIDRVLEDYGISVGGTFTPKRPADPRLIEGFTVISQKTGLKLSWKLLDQDCDRVIIRRSYDDYPKDEKSGDSVFDAKGQEVLDDKVQSGRKAFYSAFSRLGDRVSTAKMTAYGFFAEGVTDLKAIENVGKFDMRWTPPKAKYERIVIFRSAPNQHLDIVHESGVLTAKGDPKRFFVNGQNGYVDEEIAPGETYDYCVFVDYGAVGYEQVFSDGQTISGSSIPPANPVENLQIVSEKEGLKLTWENPKNRCDAVKIVRRTDRFSKTDVDGDLLYQGTGAEFIDKEKIEAGVTYYYSIFSVYRGHASEPVSEKKLYAGDVNDLKIQSHVGFVRLQWRPPAHYEEILLFRGDQRPPKVSPNGGVLRVSDGVQLTLPHRQLSDHDDKGVVPGRQYHYLIFVRYADGQYSSGKTVTGSALEPARPVDSIQIQVDKSGHVHLKWGGPDPNNKNYQYDVYRQEDSPITSPAKDKYITVGTPKYDDGKTQPGKEYYYAVYSRLGTVVADRPAQQKVFVTADVTLTRVVPQDGGVLIEWSPPLNVKWIEALREGQPIRVTSRTHVVDSGLQNERIYRYTIIAVFADKSGAEIRSKGIPCEATPVKPPDTLRDITVNSDGQTVTLTWRLPDSPVDEILISRLNAPPEAAARNLFNVSEISALIRLPGKTTSYHDRSVRPGDVCYYAFYTVKQDMAVYCGSLEVALLEEVTNLKAFNQGEEVWLRWDWPAHVDYVRVVRTPKGAKPEWIYTRGRYDGNGSMMVDKVDSRPRKYRYQIHTVRNMNGKKVTSLVGTSVEARGGCLPTITYDLDTPRQSWSPFSPKIVVVTCDVSKVDFPFSGLVLRKKKSERLRDAMDDQEVDRWSGNELQKEVILRDNHPEFDGETYYQVFLVDANESEIIQIESPSINRLRV